MGRVVVFVVILGVAVLVVTLYKKQASRDAIKADMLDIVTLIDCEGADHEFLADVVERAHPSVFDELSSADGSSLAEAMYVERMFDRMIAAARADEKSEEVIQCLESSRDQQVARNQG